MPTFHHFRADGEGGLEDWGPMSAADLEWGEGLQSGYLWLDDAANGVMAGIWAATPFVGKMGPWSTNEFMIVLTGEVTVVHESGDKLTVTAGECFFIPKGTRCSWQQSGNLSKYFLIHRDVSGLVPPEPEALRASKVDPRMALSPVAGPDRDLLAGPAPDCAARGVFEDVSGQLTAGVWAATPYERRALGFEHHELMHFVEGAATLTDGEGRTQTFAAGDTVLVPLGASVAWKSTGPVRKLYCCFAPK